MKNNAIIEMISVKWTELNCESNMSTNSVDDVKAYWLYSTATNLIWIFRAQNNVGCPKQRKWISFVVCVCSKQLSISLILELELPKKICGNRIEFYVVYVCVVMIHLCSMFMFHVSPTAMKMSQIQVVSLLSVAHPTSE